MTGNSASGLDPRPLLEALLEADRTGVIEAVHFDLRHPSIPTEIWVAEEAAYGVGFLFPSEWEGITETEAKTLFDEKPCVRAMPGDEISIKQLLGLDIDVGPLSDRHDSDKWWAILQLKRPDGTAITLEGSISFVPRDALGPHSPHLPPDDEGYADYVAPYGITFKKVGRRIRRISSARERRESVPWAKSGGGRVRVSGGVIHLVVGDSEVEGGRTTESPVGPEAEWLEFAAQTFGFAEEQAITIAKDRSFDLEALLDLVAAAAYSLARAESEIRATPLALNSLKLISAGARGGKKRAANRQEWISKNWEPHALELARGLRAKFPQKSQPDLANEVVFTWKIEGRQPSHSWMLGFIRDAERKGLLPKRNSNSGR